MDTENKLVVTSGGGRGSTMGEWVLTNYWMQDRLKDVFYDMGTISNIL